MAGTFPITRARQELGFTPTTAVRAGIDVRQGDVGAAVGQALIAGGRELGRRRQRQEQIRLRRQQMTDANSAVLAEKLRSTADAEFGAFKLTNSQETWEEERIRQTTKVASQIAGLDFSSDALESQRVQSETYSAVQSAKALTDATRQLRTDTIAAQTEAMTEAFRTGGAKEQLDAITRFRDNGANMGKDKVEVLNDIKAARDAGRSLRSEDLVNGVHAAIEAGARTGDFSIAEQLATNDVIPEKDQTVLRNTIRANKNVFNSKQEAVREANTTDFVLRIAEGRSIPGTPQVGVSEINDALRDGKIDLSQRDDLIKRIAKPDIETDRVRQAELYDMSLKIWKGAVTKAEYDKALNDSSLKLDDPAYNLLAKSGADTLKSSQAEALTRANNETRSVLVDFVSQDGFDRFIADSIRGLAPDIAKAFEDNANEERQLQFWSLSRYNAEVRQWIQENPDKLGKDFFQFSEGLRHVYWNRSIDEIRALRLERETELGINIPTPAATESVPLITTRAQYDKLPKGARYRDSKGNITTKRQ